MHASEQSSPIAGEYNATMLRNLLSVARFSVYEECLTEEQQSRASGSIHVSPNISEDVLLFMVENGLQDRFPKPCGDWKLRKTASDSDHRVHIKKGMEQMATELAKDDVNLEKSILRMLLDRVSKSFPYVSAGTVACTIVNGFIRMLDPKLIMPEGHDRCELPQGGEHNLLHPYR
jgi:hypothetical protein